MKPFEVFEIDKHAECVCLAIRKDFGVFLAEILSPLAKGNTARGAFISNYVSAMGSSLWVSMRGRRPPEPRRSDLTHNPTRRRRGSRR